VVLESDEFTFDTQLEKELYDAIAVVDVTVGVVVAVAGSPTE
jgi:hypothetical protein